MPSDNDENRNETKVVEGIVEGGVLGALAGGVIGAVAGGPVGAAAGASLGGMMGVVTGGVVTYGEDEPELRHSYESTITPGSPSWEHVSPAYRYGWESRDRPEYQGKAWDQARSDLQKGWIGGGEWSDYEPHVRTGWEYRARHHNRSQA
jgi:hypothetical protein